MTATNKHIPAVGFIGLGDQGAPMAQAIGDVIDGGGALALVAGNPPPRPRGTDAPQLAHPSRAAHWGLPLIRECEHACARGPTLPRQ